MKKIKYFWKLELRSNFVYDDNNILIVTVFFWFQLKT